MKLPLPIKTYFEADQIVGGAPPLAAFADDAIIRDEGKTHVGHKAIDTWWQETKAQYQHHAVPREVSQDGSHAIVRADVSGKFPGSPILMTFTFDLADNQITAMEVSA